MEIYDEVHYWRNRVNPNSPSVGPDITKRHIDYVSSHVKGLFRVLDFGPGVGRIFPAYNGVRFIEGFDISPTYKDRVIAASREHNLSFRLTISPKVGELPYGDKTFDAAVAVSVLLHQRPENIEKAMQELARVANKVVVVSMGYGKKECDLPNVESDDPSKFCFRYNYESICSTCGWEIDNIVRFKKYIMFTYRHR
jgi:SAM-dependent methyltransferase